MTKNNVIREWHDSEHKIEIVWDTAPENPRYEHEHLGHMYCWHSRYNMGDKHHFFTPTDFLHSVYKDDTVLYPIYMMDHGNRSFSLEPYRGIYGEFDSSQVGFIWATKLEIRETLGIQGQTTAAHYKQVKQRFAAELDEYEAWANGSVMGFYIYQLVPEGDPDDDYDWEVVDVGMGYYDEAYMKEAAEKQYQYLFAEVV